MKKNILMLVMFFIMTLSTYAFANPTVKISQLSVEHNGHWTNDSRDYYEDCEAEAECSEHIFTGVACTNVDALMAYAVTWTDLDNWNWYYYNQSQGGLSTYCDEEEYYGIYTNTWATKCIEEYGLNNESIAPLAARLKFKVNSSETHWRRADAMCLIIVI